MVCQQSHMTDVMPLVVEILSPLLVRMADHPHDMPASMQRKRPRLPDQLHVLQLVQKLIALAPVAVMAARNQVLQVESPPRDRGCT